MSRLAQIEFLAPDAAPMAKAEGAVVVFVGEAGAFEPAAAEADGLTGGAVGRLVGSKGFKSKAGEAATLAWPAGMAAEKLVVIGLGASPDTAALRKAGAAAAKVSGALTIYASGGAEVEAEIAYGLALRRYRFETYKSKTEDDAGSVRIVSGDAAALEAAFAPKKAVAEGVAFTRDLVSEPANVLTTGEFARRLEGLRDLGVDVSVMGEDEMQEKGMNLLLGVGQASDDESRLVTMKWMGGGDEAPLLVVGKGVVFDTGGVSIKPAAGMEEMTMDMGGAGVVAGLMKALALRKAKANVIGVVGLVENMLGGDAQRPGDIVKSMKGDWVEVINTDAEGRLVLADALWQAQEAHQPAAIVDLATLTGAIIIALGHENAGVFANDDAFCEAFLAAAKAEGEGAWRMPLGEAYDKQLKSRLADMKNVGGRPGGSITAAQFLKRFIKDGTPWIHLDIAGVALLSKESDLAPAGATGWGVRALDRLVRDRHERG